MIKDACSCASPFVLSNEECINILSLVIDGVRWSDALTELLFRCFIGIV